MQFAGLGVLICDDSLLIRKKLRELLEEYGCTTWEASNGREGVESYKRNRPQVVFMDIVMPELDGLEALKNIRAFDDKAKVVMLSSTGTVAKLRDALKYGACDFIQKPYEKDQIMQVLSKVSNPEGHSNV